MCRPGTGSASEPQQDSFGLVVEGVSEQHGRAVAGGVQCAVAGGAGGGLRSARTADVDPQDARVHAAHLQRLRPGGGRDGVGSGLQSVVDDQRGGRPDRRGGGGQRQ